MDSDIVPHATGDTLEFECADPIATGPTAAGLGGGEGKPGVLGLMFISTGDTSAGAAFTLSVPEEMRGTMKIGWSNSGSTLANELVNPGCTSNQANADWLIYPGGFWLKEPGCIPLVITKGQTSETIHIPIGKTCP